jgi:hypothetical protein
MSLVWCTCYKCQEDTGDGSYVSKSTRTYHRKHYQHNKQEYYSLDSNEIIINYSNETMGMDNFGYVDFFGQII